MITKFALIFLGLLFSTQGISQITLVNASFEDTPSDATIPKGWMACSNGTTPDILPGFWGEYNEANHGETYLGLITRENSTYESIGQRLKTKLETKTCYRFSLDLANGQVYSGYNNPVKLRIWLGHDKCDKAQMIYESELISNEEWENHKIEFNTEKDYDFIILEAFYQEGNFSYKGNILIDNLSWISLCGKV